MKIFSSFQIECKTCLIDIEKSFYVGDAAGRDKNWKQNITRDWSDTDR